MFKLGLWSGIVQGELGEDLKIVCSEKNIYFLRNKPPRTYSGSDLRQKLCGSQDVNVVFQILTAGTRKMRDCIRAMSFLPKALHHIQDAGQNLRDLRRGIGYLHTQPLKPREILGVERQGAIHDEQKRYSGRWFRRVQSTVAYSEAVMCLQGNRQQIQGQLFNASDDGPKYLWIDAFCGTSPTSEVGVKYGKSLYLRSR